MVLFHEGGLEQNKDDPGQITNLGVSLRFYKKRIKPDATEQDIKDLTVNQATEIYHDYFWARQPFADIDDQEIANRVFDLHINTGQGISLLQKAINASTRSHLIVDDMLGIKTLDATNVAAPDILYAELIVQAKAFYEDLAAHNASDKQFLAGWLSRLNSAP